MKNLLIAGSRSFDDFNRLSFMVVELLKITKLSEIIIISGGAKGADSLAERFAKENKIPFTLFKAKWDLYGKKAGILRNEEMGRFSDLLLALWDGESKGTKHMINFMLDLKKPVYVDIFRENNKKPLRVTKNT